jgi:hypothetical protein
MKAWRKENLSPWKEIGPVGVAGLEYILIILASQIFPNLLNDEGRSRGQFPDTDVSNSVSNAKK